MIQFTKKVVIKNESVENANQLIETVVHNSLPKDWITPKGLSKDNIISDMDKGVSTTLKLDNLCEHVIFVSQVEPKNSNLIFAMHDVLNQLTRNDVWSLIPRTDDMNTSGTKWVFRYKMDEDGNIVTNEARLVAKCYNQRERIGFDETYAPIGC